MNRVPLTFTLFSQEVSKTHPQKKDQVHQGQVNFQLLQNHPVQLDEVCVQVSFLSFSFPFFDDILYTHSLISIPRVE